MIERFTSLGQGNSLEELVQAQTNSTFLFSVKTVVYKTTITYTTHSYTYNIIVERTGSTIYFNSLKTKELLVDDIKEQLISLGFKSQDFITQEILGDGTVCDFVCDENFDNLDPGRLVRQKISKMTDIKSPSAIISSYLVDKKLDQEKIEILKSHDIINGLGGKGGVRIKDLLMPIIIRLKKDYKEEYLSKLRLIEHASYYHDLDFYIGGSEGDFFQANLDFCIQVKRVIPSNLFFITLLAILSVRGRKYFQFR